MPSIISMLRAMTQPKPLVLPPKPRALLMDSTVLAHMLATGNVPQIVTTVKKDAIPMNFFEHFGHNFISWFKKGEAVAAVAAPFINLLAPPEVSAAYNAVTQVAMQVETIAAGVTDQPISAEAKATLVLAMAAAPVTAALSQLGVKVTPDVLSSYIKAAMASLAAIPAPTTPTPTT